MVKMLQDEKLTWLKNILLERYGEVFSLITESKDILILSLPNANKIISFETDTATFSRADSNLPCTQWDAPAEGWQSVLSLPLPAPGAASLPTPLISHTERGMHVAYDILGLTYWILTRHEEVDRKDLDKHGRFPATSSHAFKYGYLDRPVVDEWLHILGQVIQRTWPGIKLKQNSFCMKVSHDVDQPSLYAFKSPSQIARMMGGHLFKRHDPQAFFQAPYIKLTSSRHISRADPFNTFEWIMDQSDRHSLISTFYFICGRTDVHDADYQPEDPRIRHLMRRIHERGHEIGLHPSYGSYESPKMIRQEADRLRRICDEERIHQREWGGRMHYLRWKQPNTLIALEHADLDYDSTLGYADIPGFRCGTCFEYPAFDPVSNKIINIRVRPLILMESTLLDDTYLGLGVGEEAAKIALSLKQTCRQVHGVFTLLWHNSTFLSAEHRSVYASLLSSK